MTNANETAGPSENLSMSALADRMARAVTAPPAPGEATPQPAPTATAEIQPAATDEAAAPVENPAQTADESQTPPGETTPGESAESEPAPEGGPAGDEPVPTDDRGKVSRIHELLRDRKEAREQVQQLTAQVQQLTQTVQQLQQTGAETPPANLRPLDRFSGHPAVKDIDAHLSNAMLTLDWCDAHADGAETDDGKGHTRTYNADQIRAIRREADNDRVALISERSARVHEIVQGEHQTRTETEAKALHLYPWLSNQQSPEWQIAVQIGREVPGIVNSPKMLLFLGDAVTRRLAREAEEKKMTTRPPAARRPNAAPPPNVRTAAAAAPRAGDPAEARVKAAEAEYRQTPTFANYQKLTLARTEAQDARSRRAAA